MLNRYQNISKPTRISYVHTFIFTLLLGVLFLFPLFAKAVFAMPNLGGSSTPNSTTLGVVRSDLSEPKRGNLPHSLFEGVNSCTCHRELLNQWSDSMHAKSLSDPFFKYEYEQVQKAEGQVAADFCLTCHGPAELMTGGTATGPVNPGTDGLNCTTCHQIAGQRVPNEKIGNASFGYAPKQPDIILRAQLADPVATHEALEEPYYNTSEYCGNCHNITLPNSGLKVAATYDEWAASSYAQEGKSCQNCHMFKDPKTRENPFTGTAAVSSAERDNISAMTFVGANVEQSNASLAEALLASAATIEFEYKGSDIVQAGEEVELKATITNTGTGHALPGGIIGMGQMWLDISSIDIEGKNKTEIERIDLSAKIVDANGADPGAAFHKATAIAEDNRLMPGESKTAQVSFTMPANVDIRYVLAELNYQTARDSDLEPSGVENPTTLMTAIDQGFFTSEEAKAEAARIRAEQQRLKDAGGLLLDEEGSSFNWKKAALYSGIVLAVLALVAVAIVLLPGKHKPRHSCKKRYAKHKKVC